MLHLGYFLKEKVMRILVQVVLELLIHRASTNISRETLKGTVFTKGIVMQRYFTNRWRN